MNGRRINLVLYNLKGGHLPLGRRWASYLKAKAEAIASAFAYVQPIDVAVFNEAVRGLVGILAERLEWEHSVFQELVSVRGDAFGNAILSRLPFDGVATQIYKTTRGESRSYISVTLRPDGGPALTVFGTHLSVDASARLAQAQELALAAGVAGDRVVVAGDFNIDARPDNELGGGNLVWQTMDSQDFMRADDYGDEATYAPTFGRSRIDLVWVKKNRLIRPGLTRLGDEPPTGIGTFGATRRSFPSDHRGVIARLVT